MLNLFKIGAADYTHNILNGTYNVRNEDVFNEWVDGFGVNRQQFKRKRITGGFTMKFRNKASYDAFVSALANATTTARTVECSVYCVNTNEYKTGNFFITLDATLSQNSNMLLDYGSVKVTIKEA